MRFFFDDKKLPDLLDKIAYGRMCLFLGAGAGASLGGKKLEDRLIEFAELPVSQKTHKLSRIYDAAIYKTSKSTVNEFLKNVFIRSVASWQKAIPSFVWKRIYTTNIDDILNDSVNKCRNPLQEYVYKNFRDSSDSSTKDNDTTQVVHLHGYVRKASAGYVFGPKEYATAVKDNLPWHVKFADDFSNNSFVFVGTNLDESDLDVYMSYRRAMSSKPTNEADSFLVTTHVDDILVNAMAEYGINCIESSAEEFFTWLDSSIPNRKRYSDILLERTPKIAQWSSTINKNAYIKFMNQFESIDYDQNISIPDPELHDFFNGDAPLWYDIKQNNDAIFTPVYKIKEIIKNDIPPVIILTGVAGCGKTTALMRLAKMLSTENWQTFFFADESYIDVDSAKAVLKSTKGARAAVVVDRASDYIDQVDKLVQKLNLYSPKSDLQIVFILGERENRLGRILDALSVRKYQTICMNWLDTKNIGVLINKLKEKDKLRILRNKTPEQRSEFFEQHADKQLLVAMKELAHDGGKFHKILAKEFLDINQIGKKIYSAVALCHAQGFRVSLNVVHRMFIGELGIDDIKEMIEHGCLKGVVINVNNRLSTRHTLIAQELFKSPDLSLVLNRTIKAKIMTDLMKALAPMVNNVKELSKGTPESILVKNLMDFDHIENIMGRNEESIDKFFREIKDYYEWNSKYWAQRGLFESQRNKFADAIDFVNYAVDKDSHWTIRNSKGTVYLRAAVYEKEEDYKKSKRLLNDGIELIDAVLIERGYQDIKGYKLILSKIVEFCRKWSLTEKWIMDLFDHYYSLAEKNLGEDSGFERNIKGIKTELIKMKLFPE